MLNFEGCIMFEKSEKIEMTDDGFNLSISVGVIAFEVMNAGKSLIFRLFEYL